MLHWVDGLYLTGKFDIRTTKIDNQATEEHIFMPENCLCKGMKNGGTVNGNSLLHCWTQYHSDNMFPIFKESYFKYFKQYFKWRHTLQSDVQASQRPRFPTEMMLMKTFCNHFKWFKTLYRTIDFLILVLHSEILFCY